MSPAEAIFRCGCYIERSMFGAREVLAAVPCSYHREHPEIREIQARLYDLNMEIAEKMHERLETDPRPEGWEDPEGL
jgi:hypothetical protein